MPGTTGVRPPIRYSGSDSSDEPFDMRPQPPPRKQRSTENIRRIEEELEDGELPSLTKKGDKMVSSGRVINGQRTTTRPLSPPNPAGLKVDRGQRQFWNQLENEDDVESEEEYDEFYDARHEHPTYDDDMPDDEMMLSNRRRRRRRAVQREREMDNASRQDDEYSSLGAANTYTTQDTEDGDGNFCDQTLTALGDICGTGGLGLIKTSDKVTAEGKQLKPPNNSEAQEEHTAIEVEFVEPSGKLSPQRKNAYLTAMARKAKLDFHRKKDASSKAEVHSNSPEEIADMYSQDEHIYHSFNAAEKRKFLKLINSGVLPAQASHQILRERSEVKSVESKEGTTIDVSQDTDAPSMDEKPDGSSNRPSRLAFWKKGKSTETPSSDIDPTHPESEESDNEFAKSGINYYDGVRMDHEDDDSLEVPEQNASTPLPKQSSSMKSPMGFAALRERRSKSTSRPRKEPKSEGGSKPTNVGALAAVSAAAETTPMLHDMVHEASSGDSLPDSGRSTDETPHKVEATQPTHGSGSQSAKTSRGAPSRTVEDLLPAPDAPKKESRDPQAALKKIEDDMLRELKIEEMVQSRAGLQPSSPSSVIENANKETEQLEQADQPLDVSMDTYLNSTEAYSAARSTPTAQQTSEGSETGTSGVTGSKSSRKRRPGAGKGRLAKAKEVEEAVKALQENKVEEALKATQKPKKKVHVEGPLDTSIESYLDSTDVYSSAKATPGQPPSDASVYTAGTGITGLTGATTYTHSSRKRRPGAAKSRLAKAKEIEEAMKGKGWHESIRAAAASSNRKWEPKAGWVDYEEPQIEEEPEFNKSTEKLRIDLNRSLSSQKHQKASNEHPTKDKSSTPVVPFPQSWEKERVDMIQSHSMDMSLAYEEEKMDVSEEIYQEEKKSETPAVSPPRTEAVSQDPSRPRGWLESMKIASASLAQEGKVWDPEKGWMQIGSDKRAVPDLVDFDEPEAVDSGETGGNRATDSLKVIARSVGDAEGGGVVFGAKESDKKLNQWIAKAEQGPRKQSEHSTESSAKAVVAPAEQYVQLGDNGSVSKGQKKTVIDGRPPVQKSGDSNYISDDDDTEADSAPLLNASGAFPTAEDRPFSPVIDIVKEKVDEEDMNLFPQERPRPNRTSSAVRGRDASRDATFDQASLRSTPSRRGAGPIDTDEVDETWDSDDEQRSSMGWQAETMQSLTARKPELRGADTQPVEKPIPRLKGSRKDTSPISSRRTPVKPEGVPVTPSPTKSEEYAGSSRVLDFSSKSEGTQEDSRSPSVKARRERWEAKSGHNILEDLNTTEDGLRSANTTPGTAEWKSFLGKKVRAESAAAARNSSGTGNRPESGHTSPERERAQASEGETDDDTLFEFSEKRESQKIGDSVGVKSPTFRSDISPIRNSDEHERAESDAYGPGVEERGNFFKRLAECAAPVMPTNMPRNVVPSGVCARPDLVSDKEEDLVEPKRSKSAPRPTRDHHASEVRSSAGSTVSADGFGAKTAYLEAIAMRAAVSKPRSSSRKRGSASSVVSSSSSVHSEKWQAFLERKKASGTPIKSRSSNTSEVSKAAEKYASEKVEQMMSMLSSRSKPAATGSKEVNSNESGKRTPESVKAAEDLAAARVEAMMAALSNSQLDEGEI